MFTDDELNLLESDVYSQEVLKEIVEEAKKNNCMPYIGGTLPQNNIRFLKKFEKIIEEKSEDENKKILVDMSLTMRECKERLFDSLKNAGKKIIHIILTADEETIKFRIRNDDNRNISDIANEIIQIIKSLENN